MSYKLWLYAMYQSKYTFSKINNIHTQNNFISTLNEKTIILDTKFFQNLNELTNEIIVSIQLISTLYF